jgi:hypothetical protein
MVLPGVGHIAFEEMPEICNQAMREWLLNPMPFAKFSQEGDRDGMAFPVRSAETGVSRDVRSVA